MAQTPEFKDFIPGMEFFQTLLKGAGMPSQFANWVAPTMDVDEIEQKITDLKAVLSWLETNARMTQNMIQALEVQRMTLHALKTMNVDLQAFAKGMVADSSEAQSAVSPVAEERTDQPEEAPAAAAPMFDPMQWWNTMTQQFTELANKAMQEGGALQAGFAAPGPASSPRAQGASPVKAAAKKAVAKTAGKAANKSPTRQAKPAARRARPAVKKPR